MRVKEDGESECPPVMGGIRIKATANIIRRESAQTSIRSDSTRELEKPSSEEKQMAVMKQIATAANLYTHEPMAAVSNTGASSHPGDTWHDIKWRKVHQNVRRLQAHIVQATKAGLSVSKPHLPSEDVCQA